MSLPLLRACDATRGVIVAERLRSAHTHWTRLRGLLGRGPLAPGEGLWLWPCRQVHTFGLRTAIDVAFLDDAGRVLHVVEALPPWRVSPHVADAASVLELPAGTLARAGVCAGTRLDLGPGAPRRGGALGAAVGNVGLALLAAFFFAAHAAQGRASGRWLPVLPILVEEALLVGLFLVRRPSRRTSTRLGDWALAVGSTYLPLLLRATSGSGALAPLGLGLQTLGLAVSVLALCALGPSLGIVAADRGVRTGGLYRRVRHPLYAGETLSYLGYLVSYPSLGNALVVLVTTLALVVRAGVEERFLACDPAYRAYCATVRWRFVPGLY
jgi:protein-S-isoprenylcysteine O-methyltransferase Ste14/uncharacterized membrane protein (UPF0127 family)